MTVFEAYEYLKPFQNNRWMIEKVVLEEGYFITEISLGDWCIVNAKRPEVILKLKGKLPLNEAEKKFNLMKMSSVEFIKNHYKELNIEYDHRREIEKRFKTIYYIPEEVAVTKNGIISAEEYYLASDILEETYFLKKKDMIDGETYLAINGKRYVYYKVCELWKDQLIEEGEISPLINRSSIKLIEHIKDK